MSDQDKSFIELVDESFKTIHTGEIVKGTVIGVKPEEIILNIGYKSDGILTRNEYSNDNSLDLTTVVKVGDEMDVKVLKAGDSTAWSSFRTRGWLSTAATSASRMPSTTKRS